MMVLEPDLPAINHARWYRDEAEVRATAAFRRNKTGNDKINISVRRLRGRPLCARCLCVSVVVVSVACSRPRKAIHQPTTLSIHAPVKGVCWFDK